MNIIPNSEYALEPVPGTDLTFLQCWGHLEMEQDSCPSRPCGCRLKVPYMKTQGDKYLEYIFHIIFKTAP